MQSLQIKKATGGARGLFDDELPPAPNYRLSDDETLCVGCYHAQPGQRCALYDFRFHRSRTCDAWTTDLDDLHKSEGPHTPHPKRCLFENPWTGKERRARPPRPATRARLRRAQQRLAQLVRGPP